MADFLYLSEHPLRFSLCAFLRTRLPQMCVLCQQPTYEDGLCQACVADWHFQYQQVRWRCHRCKVAPLCGDFNAFTACPSCLLSPTAWHQLCIAFDYQAPLDALVWRFKERHQLRMVPALGRLLLMAMQRDQLVLPANTVVSYIPARASAIWQRGFNPAAELARFVAARLGLRLVHGLITLSDRQALQAQKHRSLQQRRQYAQQAFSWRGQSAPFSVLLVDDVFTSGSTMQGAAHCFLSNGVVHLTALALARVPWSR